jgi:hypothetical protein
MTPKNDLHELIHSLTESEVSVFRKEILKREGQHIYLQVFDAILDMEEYKEEALKKQFKGKKTLNNFSIAKNNLYEKVLEVLCQLPHHQNIETRFDKFKQQVAILIRKSLFKQAMERVEKAIRLAEKMEAFKRIFDLYELQREIARQFLTPQEYLDLLRELRNKENFVKEAETNLARFRDIFDTASIAQKFPPNIRQTMVNGILSQDVMQDPSECRSVTAQIYFFRIWNHLYFIMGRTTGWQFFSEKLIELFEQNPALLSDPGKFFVYVNAISNLAYNSIATGEFAKAMEAAEKLQSMRKELKTGENEALIFCRYWKLQLLYYQKRLDEKNGMLAVEKIQEGLKRFKNKLSKNDTMELIHYVGVFMLIMGKHSEAISWILKNRDDKAGHNRPDLHDLSWILFLTAHFSLGHLDVVEQQVPGTLRYLKERKKLTPFYKALMTFFRKTVHAKDQKEAKELLGRLQNELEELMRQEGDASFLELFNFMAWAESRRSGQSMVDVLRTWKVDFLEQPS